MSGAQWKRICHGSKPMNSYTAISGAEASISTCTNIRRHAGRNRTVNGAPEGVSA